MIDAFTSTSVNRSLKSNGMEKEKASLMSMIIKKTNAIPKTSLLLKKVLLDSDWILNTIMFMTTLMTEAIERRIQTIGREISIDLIKDLTNQGVDPEIEKENQDIIQMKRNHIIKVKAITREADIRHLLNENLHRIHDITTNPEDINH